MNNTNLALALFATFTSFATVACEPAPESAGELPAQLGESDDAVLSYTRCDNVLDFIASPGPMLIPMAFITYADAGVAAVASTGVSLASGGSATVVQGFTSAYRAIDTSVADRGSFRLRRTFINLGGTLYETNSRVLFELHRASTGASVTSFEVGATECSVAGNEATITATSPNDGRLVIKIVGMYIGG